MAGLSENQLVEELTEAGDKLSQPPSSIPELLDLLDEVELIFTKIKQRPPQLVQEALLIPQKALIADELFRHSDPDVKITVASCLKEVTRISAPTPPYDDDRMREIFELIVSSFENLSCQPSRCYSKAVLILQSVARLRSCVMMLDLDCESLVTKMFEIFQRIISPKHPQAVHASMVKIMSVMIQENDSVSLELLSVLLSSVKMENKGVSPASWEMGVKVLEACADKLKPVFMETVLSMGFCLEDYAPILASICQPEEDVTNFFNDSSILVNNEHSGNPNHPVEFVQGLKALDTRQTTPASSSGSKALVTEGTTSERERKPNSYNIDKDAGRPRKKDNQGVSGDKALRKKNDVSGASGSSGKKILKQSESSDGSWNRSKTGKTRKDRLPSNDAPKNLRKRASSSDDEVIETPHGRKNYKDDLVGSRIKVWWPLDRRYYEGTITKFNASLNKHRIDYDDGDEETLNFRKERWEFLGDEPPTDIASLFDKQTSQPPSIISQHEASTEEKQVSKIDNGKKEVTPASEGEPGDARDHATLTTVKSEISESLLETKRLKLSDGQHS